MPDTVRLPILHFNDVYRVNQRYVPQPGAPRVEAKQNNKTEAYISVSQFGNLLLSERDKWPDRKDKGADDKPAKDGLVLFSGDIFNPSVESSVTRGSHMVPLINALKVDCACVGNHDFDFGFPHLTKLIKSTTFPWLLSNIVDRTTEAVPDPLKRYWVTERRGVKIGVIGLVEQDWIRTIPSWPSDFVYRDMVQTAMQLSKELREEQGVEMIIALTHCRLPNDLMLATQLGAVAKGEGHGVDIVMGGHDHMYYIGKGAASWDGWSGDRDQHGAEADNGAFLIKSGTDFRDLSSFTLDLAASSSTRKRVITSLTGKHHYVLPSTPSSPAFDDLVKSLLSSVSSTLSKPVCFTLTPFDARSEVCRTTETGLGNWIADILLQAYSESMIESGGSEDKAKEVKELTAEDKQVEEGVRTGDFVEKNGRRPTGAADCVIICGGTIRGDSQYGPGKITLGDVLEILPFEDPTVVLEMDGKGIWDTMESALSKWPAQEGRFPIVAGLRVEWDHTLPTKQRVKSIHLVKPPAGEDDEDEDDQVEFVDQDDGTRVEIRQNKIALGDEVKNEEGGRVYRVITREYMAQGYDGFDALKNRKFLVDDETGLSMSSILRSFLLGSAYIFRHKQLLEAHHAHLSSRTDQVLLRAQREHNQPSPTSSLASSPTNDKFLQAPVASSSSPVQSPMSEKSGGDLWSRARRHVVSHNWNSIRDALFVSKSEHMSLADCIDGDEMRHQHTNGNSKNASEAKIVKPRTAKQAALFVDADSKAELTSVGDDLAIVSPRVDGRMRDVAEKR